MIGIKIKLYREKLGLTQEELGEKAGITGSPRQRIHQIESGYREPSPQILRSICEAMATTPGELTGTVPDRAKEILNRGEQPTLKSENEFYYVAGLFVAALVSLYPASKKYRLEYFQPVNICHGQRLKDRIRRDLFTTPTSKAFVVESETRNKLIAAFFGWQTEVDGLENFNKLNVMEDYMLGYFQTNAYPII
jgi:transcriptional regulator with XRE-family HTH domain